jgi:hypothetical protein
MRTIMGGKKIQHREKTLRLMLHYGPGDSNLIGAMAESTTVTIQ